MSEHVSGWEKGRKAGGAGKVKSEEVGGGITKYRSDKRRDRHFFFLQETAQAHKKH